MEARFDLGASTSIWRCLNLFHSSVPTLRSFYFIYTAIVIYIGPIPLCTGQEDPLTLWQREHNDQNMLNVINEFGNVRQVADNDDV